MTNHWHSRTFDLFFLVIIDLKRSIGRRWLFKSGATFIFRWFCFLNTTCPNIHWLFYTSRFLVQRIAKRFARRSKAVSPWPGLMLMPPCIHWPVPCSIRYHWHLKVNLPTHWGRLRPSQRPVKNVSLDLLIAAAAFKVIAKEICMIANHCGRWMRRHGGQPCWHCWQCWIMGAV